LLTGKRFTKKHKGVVNTLSIDQPDFNATQEVLSNKKQAILSWAEIHYAGLLKIFDARFTGNIEAFKRGVNALELLISGQKDDDYLKDMFALNHKANLMRDNYSEEEINLFYYDQKMESLSCLITRINKGIQQIRDLLNGSDLVKEIANRLLKGIGQNIFITGPPGSGKSYTGIALALEVLSITGVKYSVDNVAFTPEEFMNIYNNEKMTPQGGFVMFDEAGVGYNSKDFSKESNRLFSKLLMTIRHRSVMVIFTAPDLGNMDKDGRRLLHWWFETADKDERKKVVTIKPYVVKIIQRTGDIHFPFPFFNGKKLSRVDVLKIPDRYSRPYEVRAKQFKDDLALETQQLLAVKKDSKVEEFKTYIRLREKGLKIYEVCDEMEISRNKGTALEKFYKNRRYSLMN
jgi:hypothetical protein